METHEILADHFPDVMDKCSYFNQYSESYIILSNADFYACRYGPLKPNRIYTATIYAENNSGRSEGVKYKTACIMDYAVPDHIEPPETFPRSNMFSFGIKFNSPVDEINGPIAYDFNFLLFVYKKFKMFLDVIIWLLFRFH